MTDFFNRSAAWIDTAALRENFGRVRSVVDARSAVLAVVKADAYGHGAEVVASVLEEAGADWFGVATVEEGEALRAVGIRRPILVMYGIDAADAPRAVRHDLSVAIVDAAAVAALADSGRTKPLRVHLELDTGMTRLGVMPEELGEVAARIAAAPSLDLEGFFSHLGNADDAYAPFPDRQIGVFRDAVATLDGAGLRPRLVHLANSVATLTRPDAHWAMVRPGVCLYGVTPQGVQGPPMTPAMRLEARIWRLWEVPAGRQVSYDQTFETTRRTRIAVLPIGYADGYPRSLSNRGEVLIEGRRAPVIGRVCMDVTMVDVTDVPGVEQGGSAVLWGNAGDHCLPVDEVAAACDTIPYELLARLGKRVPRRLQEEDG